VHNLHGQRLYEVVTDRTLGPVRHEVAFPFEKDDAVGGDYEAPFAFNGTIVRAEVMATGPVVRDPVAEVAAILASQ
jgi:hypothetical protein